jgi:hypothetical protein
LRSSAAAVGAQADPRGTVHVLDPGAQNGARGAAQVFGRCSKSLPRGTARCASQVLDRGAQSISRDAARCASQLFDRVARPLPAAPLVVRRR